MFEIIENLPFSEYLKLDAMNASTIKALDKSPRHYEERNNRASTPTLSRGTLAHSAILEPDQLSQAIVTPEKRENESGKSVKFVRSGKHWEEFQAEHEGKYIVSHSEMIFAGEIATGIRSNPDAVEALEGRHELTLIWDDPKWGKCKARLDAMNDYVADLKTTQNLSHYAFANTCIKYGYDIQGAWYLNGAKACGLDPQGFRFVGIQTASPYDSRVFHADENMIAHGQEKIDEAWTRLHEMGSTTDRPGEYPGVCLLSPEYYDDGEIT